MNGYGKRELIADVAAALVLTLQMEFSYANGFDFKKDTMALLSTFVTRLAILVATRTKKGKTDE